MNKRNSVRCLCFVFIICIILGSASWLFRDKYTTLSCMYSEPDETLDVVIVGSSHVNNGYIPNLLWENCNASACNVFSWSQPMWISYHYIQETLKTQTPSIIVLEMFGITYGHSYIMPQEIDKTSYSNSFNIDFGLNYLNMAKTVEFCGLELRNFEDFLPLVKYHTKWKNFDIESALYNPHKDIDPIKGYGISTQVYSVEKPQYYTTELMEPYEYSVKYLDKIVKLCEQNGIELVFTMVPYVYNEAEVKIYNWLEEYSASNDIPFINYNGEDGERIGFDFATDLSDNGHVNLNGALKVTQDLCDYLNENYKFPSPESRTNMEQLDNHLKQAKQIIEVQDILMSDNFDDWLPLVLSNDNITLFLMAESGDNYLNDILNVHNFDCLNKTNIAMLSDTEQIYNEYVVNFDFFNKNGVLKFDTENRTITINGTDIPISSDGIVGVIYDEILQRPLTCISYTDGIFKQREFTSDILNLYK